MFFFTRRFQKQLQLRWREACIQTELVIWRQLITFNRLARAVRLWFQPMGLNLFVLPGAFVLGFIISLLK